eukprot:1655495-Pyramimonas_sp.AAC.1
MGAAAEAGLPGSGSGPRATRDPAGLSSSDGRGGTLASAMRMWAPENPGSDNYVGRDSIAPQWSLDVYSESAWH